MIKLFSDSKGSYYMNQSEFLEKAAVWIEADKSSWTHITLLAYFCYRYKERNGVRFRFARWGGHPAKTKESRDFSRLIKAFLPEDFDNLTKENQKLAKKKSISKSYNYINWIFDYKFRTSDKSVTGTGIFLNHNIMNHFERMWFNHQNKKKKESKLNSFVSWIKDNHPSFLDNYDFEDEKDLGIVLSFIEGNGFGEETSEFLVYKKAKSLGL